MTEPRFTYGDVVLVRAEPIAQSMAGKRAWIIAVFPDRASRPGSALDALPDGPAYTVEFEDGTTAELHEDWLCSASDGGTR